MATISEALNTALELHAVGRFDEAGVLYGRILDAVPDHAQALYLAGTLMCQQSRFDEAHPLLERAVAFAPDLVAAHLNLARLHARAEHADRSPATAPSAHQMREVGKSLLRMGKDVVSLRQNATACGSCATRSFGFWSAMPDHVRQRTPGIAMEPICHFMPDAYPVMVVGP